MSQYRSGIINSTTALIASGVTLPLGFIPDRFQMYNLTILEVNPPNSATVAESLWLKPMPSPSALQTTYTTGDPVVSYITTPEIVTVIPFTNVIELVGEMDATVTTPGLAFVMVLMV